MSESGSDTVVMDRINVPHLLFDHSVRQFFGGHGGSQKVEEKPTARVFQAVGRKPARTKEQQRAGRNQRETGSSSRWPYIDA